MTYLPEKCIYTMKAKQPGNDLHAAFLHINLQAQDGLLNLRHRAQ